MLTTNQLQHEVVRDARAIERRAGGAVGDLAGEFQEFIRAHSGRLGLTRRRLRQDLSELPLEGLAHRLQGMQPPLDGLHAR